MGRRIPPKEAIQQTAEGLQTEAEANKEFLERVAEEVKREIPKASVEINRDGSADFYLSVALWKDERVYVTSNQRTEGKKVGKFTMVWCGEQQAGDNLWNTVEKSLLEK